MQPGNGTRSRRRGRIAVLLVLTAVMVVWWCDRRVTRMAAPFVYDTVDAVPALDMAMVLGTSDRARGGLPNRYFTHRIDAAVALYEDVEAQPEKADPPISGLRTEIIACAEGG
jgi:vancomycin permeability regulator SanA